MTTLSIMDSIEQTTLNHAELDQVSGGDATSNGILAAVVATVAAMGPTPGGLLFAGAFATVAIVGGAVAAGSSSSRPKN